MEICNNSTCGIVAAESVFQADFGFVAVESVCFKQLVASLLWNLSVPSDLWLCDYGICPFQVACGFAITEFCRAKPPAASRLRNLSVPSRLQRGP